jgi:Mn2+/Fe2+ NRAMP family transporter
MEQKPNSENRRFIIGPAVLVTAAFIGPGTVITASKAGAQYGGSLLWAVVFACVTTIVLQEMAARLGIVSQSGLGDGISKLLSNPAAKTALAILVVAAILIGNAAYQTGNITGATSGVEIIQSSLTSATVESNTESTTSSTLTSRRICIAVIGVIAAIVVLIGKYSLLQKLLTGLVIGMSGLFLLAAGLSKPTLTEIGNGLLPSLPTGSEWLVIGLIGTTVVPYNLFLHASLAAKQWTSVDATPEQRADAIRQSRWDTITSVALGGLVTAAILLSASSAFREARNSVDGVALSNVGEVAAQLKPAIGSAAKIMFAIGLFAAGLTSAITAPIAAGYAAAGCFGWPNELSDWRLKATALLVIAIGVVMGIAFGSSPQQTIILAQVANGILLPLLAILLLLAANQSKIMGGLTNGPIQNILAVLVIGIVLLIAARQFKSVYEKLAPPIQKPAIAGISGANEESLSNLVVYSQSLELADE